MPDHAQDVRHLDRIAGALRLGQNVGLLTDANVAASNTVAALKTAVTTAAAATHAQNAAVANDVQQAIDWMRDTQRLTDAIQAPLTGVAGLIALTGATNTWESRRHE